MTFDGAAYDALRDGDRLRSQLATVRRAMSDNEWHTLLYLTTFTGAPEASVSARLRDLRKEKFGGHVIERRHVYQGLWEYRMARPGDWVETRGS